MSSIPSGRPILTKGCYHKTRVALIGTLAGKLLSSCASALINSFAETMAENEGFRTVGEFESQESVMMAWTEEEYACKERYSVDDVSLAILRNLYGNVSIIVLCDNELVKQRAIAKVTSAGLNVDDIKFVVYPTPTPFPRDFGADVLVNDRGQRLHVEFRFNTYGLLSGDDQMSKTIGGCAGFHADLIGIKRKINAGLFSEGGAREYNGQGVMLAIEDTEVNKRNKNMSKKKIEDEFMKALNLQKIVWLPRATYDDESTYSGKIPGPDGTFSAYRSITANGHIDEICRFVDQKTILLADISESEAKDSPLAALNKERLDEAFQVLKNATDADGKAFNIIRMPFAYPLYVTIGKGDHIYEHWHVGLQECKKYDDALADLPVPSGDMVVLPALSYCNFLITNNVVLVSKYYAEGMPLEVKQKDEEAMAILKRVFPTRKVIAVDTTALNLYGGGIHCNTRNVPVGLS